MRSFKMIKRRKTRIVKIGNIKIGGSFPVAIQSMTKTNTANLREVLKQIKQLEDVGCAIIRLAIKNKKDAKAIAKIKRQTKTPLVADIHFDYRLALESIKNGIDKIRLNPGNIYKKDEVKEVVKACKDRKIPIRVGLNSGSLPMMRSFASLRMTTRGKNFPSGQMDVVDRLVKGALDYIKLLEDFHFFDIVISLKSSNVLETVWAYKRLAKLCDYPFHLGVTASGPKEQGLVKSSLALGVLLSEGIGDTIRVSLTASPEEEVLAAKSILQNLGLGNFGPEIISCPTCGRCEVDLIKLVKEFESKLNTVHSKLITGNSQPFRVALMGCVVNGPGEAREADLGIAFGKKEGLFFKKGRPQFKINQRLATEVLLREFKRGAL